MRGLAIIFNYSMNALTASAKILVIDVTYGTNKSGTFFCFFNISWDCAFSTFLLLPLS